MISRMNLDFRPIQEAVKRMDGFAPPWFVSGGWAIDLFLGTITREHADVEIGIFRSDQAELHQRFKGWTLEKVVPFDPVGAWVPWTAGEELQLPIHQVRATPPAPESEPAIEFLLNERTETSWRSRRHAGLVRPYEEAVITSQFGIPILAPEIQLLFKAKQTRPKDHADFVAAVSLLSPTQRSWLQIALAQYHPDHPWIEMLERIKKA